jgi:hypothetical protein
MKRFACRAFFLLTLVFFFQIAIAFIWPPRFPKEISELNQALQQNTDVIFLGDSTVYWCGPEDKTTQSIVTKVQYRIPSLSFHETTHGGYHLGVYINYCRWIAANANPPRLVIIPVNLRTFSPFWDIPGWQFENVRDTLAYLKNPLFRAFYMPLGIFKFSNMETTDEAYEAAPVYDGLRRVGTVWDFKGPDNAKWTQKQIKNAFLFYYMGQITEQNRKVQTLRQVIRILKGAGIPVLLYFVPTDVQSGMEYHGQRFRRQLEQNAAFLKQVIQQEGITSYDFTCALGMENFVWRLTGDCVDEHIKEAGRQYVADQLTEIIKRDYLKK